MLYVLQTEAELQDMQKRMQDYQHNAQQQVDAKSKNYETIIDKVTCCN